MSVYEKYSERKLYSVLNNTKSKIVKLESEKDRIQKKIDSALKKEIEIKQVLINKLSPNEPNEETAYALKNPQSIGKYKEFKKFEEEIEAEEAAK